MTDPDDERPVDFVVGNPGPDGGPGRPHGSTNAEPAADRHDAARRRRRLRLELGGGALALLVVVLVLRASLRPHDPRSSLSSPPAPSSASSATGPRLVGPPPDSTAVPTSATRSAAPVALPKSVPTRRGDDPRACPGLRCRTTVGVPAAVTAAVQSAIPESTVELVETVRLEGHHDVLWFRSIVARAASERVVVSVQAPASGDRSGVTFGRSGVVGTTTVATTLGPWHVVVQVIDPTGGQGDVVTMSRLARDPRIATG